MIHILAIKKEASTIRFKLYSILKSGKANLILTGDIVNFNLDNMSINLRKTGFDQAIFQKFSEKNISYEVITDELFKLPELKKIHLNYIIYKVPCGGKDYVDITLLHEKTLKKLESISANIASESGSSLLSIAHHLLRTHPKIKHYACYDDSFHSMATNIFDNQTIKSHGLACQYIMERLPDIVDKKLVRSKWVIVNIESDILSISGVNNNKCLINLNTLNSIELINQRSIQGTHYKNLTDLIQSNQNSKSIALNIVSHIIINQILRAATYTAGIEGLIFSGTIGTCSSELREVICNKLEWLGLLINNKANIENRWKLSKKNSKIKAFIIPYNEELAMINQLMKRIK